MYLHTHTHTHSPPSSPHTHLHPYPTLQEEIKKRLRSHEFNSAFELALSTSDLHLVMFLCKQASPEEVFDKSPFPLTQPVLLSLIQQLSVDLQDSLNVKIKLVSWRKDLFILSSKPTMLLKVFVLTDF